MPDPELPTSVADSLRRAAEIVYQVFRQLKLALEDRHSGLATLALGIMRLEMGPAIPGYEPLLISVGCPAFESRFVARVILCCGEALAREEGAERSLASALRKLARTAGKSTLVISRRAKALRDLLGEDRADAALNRACRKAKQPELATELLRLISRAIDRDAAACETLTARVASLISYLPSPKGRPLSVATATHELVLDELHYRGKPRAFTWDSIDNAFGDPATEATRIATGERSFDPRPAYDRFKRHLAEDPTV